MTQKPAFPKPRFYLILALLAAAGFGFTAVCGVWNISRPLWGNIALSAVPTAVFLLLWQLSRRGRWRGVPVLAATIALFVLFLAGGLMGGLASGIYTLVLTRILIGAGYVMGDQVFQLLS